MVNLGTGTLEAWWEMLALATTLANVRAVPVTDVWTYEAWVWEGTPSLVACTAWGRELEILAGSLVHQLQVGRPAVPPDHSLAPGNLVPSAYDTFLTAMVVAWARLEETDTTSFTELGDIMPLVRLLVRAHRLVGQAHRYLSATFPCHKGPTRVGPAYILPVITTVVHELTVASSHLANPCHTAPGGEWRLLTTQEIRGEIDQDYREQLEELEQELQVLRLGVSQLELGRTSWPAAERDSGSEGYGTPVSSPSRRLPVGGPCGMMFSPPGELEEEDEKGGGAPDGSLQRTPVPPSRSVEGLASRVKTRRGTEARREAEAMAASDLFGSPTVTAPVSTSQDRLSSLEAQVSSLTAAVNNLLAVARDLRRPEPPTESKPSSPRVGSALGTEAQRELPSPADEVTVIKLRQDRRKERQTTLKTLLPWAKHLAVLPDRTLHVRPALHRLYGPPVYQHVGDVEALEDGIKMFRSMAYPSPDSAGTLLTFKFTPAVAMALVYHRVGGPTRDDDPLYLRTVDLLPLADGEDRRLASVNTGMFATEPVWAARRTPPTMAAFRECGLRMAEFLGLHWGARCRFELIITVEVIHDKGSRSPSVMTPGMACHLLDLLILSVVEAVYEDARGGTPLPVGTAPLTPNQLELYRARGWSTEGPTFIASLPSEFMRRWWYEPLQEAALSDPTRRGTAMRLMGMDPGASKPPKGGPTGGSEEPPSGVPPPPSPAPRTRAFFTVEEATAAATCLPGSRPSEAPVCMRYLAVKGCQRGPQCRFHHVAVTTVQLRECCRQNAHLQRILAFFGGPSPRNLSSQSTQASNSPAPQAGRSGGPGEVNCEVSDSDSSVDEVPSGPWARGGKASGGVEVQVPYLLALGGCYPRAPLDDARSSPPSRSLHRPLTAHPDASVRVFNGASHLACVTPPVLAPMRAGGDPLVPAVLVSPTGADGSFTVTLGSLVLRGQDAGQSLALGDLTIYNSCVVLSFATVLGVAATDLFSHLVQEARSAATLLGPPPHAETASGALLRSFCHDILSSCHRGHPLDALVLLYFPPPALLRAVVVVVHTRGSSVALDVLRGPLADPSSPLLGCLQRSGDAGAPGHMQPLSFPPFTLSALEHWARDLHIPVRLLSVQSWQDWLSTEPAGPSVLWADHATCDFCLSPRFPLPPAVF